MAEVFGGCGARLTFRDGQEARSWPCFQVIGSCGDDAGGGPAVESVGIAVSGRSGHEVSIRISGGSGDGRYLGVQPRSKTSMTTMRPPQHGQGCGNADCCSGSDVAAGSDDVASPDKLNHLPPELGRITRS